MCAGQIALSYVTAKTHGLAEEAEQLAESLGDSVPPVSSQAQLMQPPQPILREDNWPLLTVSKGYFESLVKGGPGAQSALHLGRSAEHSGQFHARGCQPKIEIHLPDDRPLPSVLSGSFDSLGKGGPGEAVPTKSLSTV